MRRLGYIRSVENKSMSRIVIKVYKFKAKLWKYQGPAGWYFVTLPKALAKKIRDNHGRSEEGWGRLRAAATLGDSSWKTAIWFDSKAKSYLLPIKASIRKSESIQENSAVLVHLTIECLDLKRAIMLKRSE